MQTTQLEWTPLCLALENKALQDVFLWENPATHATGWSWLFISQYRVRVHRQPATGFELDLVNVACPNLRLAQTHYFYLGHPNYFIWTTMKCAGAILGWLGLRDDRGWQAQMNLNWILEYYKNISCQIAHLDSLCLSMKNTGAACALSTARWSGTGHTAWTAHTTAVSTWNNKPPANTHIVSPFGHHCPEPSKHTTMNFSSAMHWFDTRDDRDSHDNDQRQGDQWTQDMLA